MPYDPESFDENDFGTWPRSDSLIGERVPVVCADGRQRKLRIVDATSNVTQDAVFTTEDGRRIYGIFADLEGRYQELGG